MAFVTDTFTDVNGTALESHTGETGATWTEDPAAATGVVITSNRARKSGAAGSSTYYASGAPASADYEVEAVVRPLSATDALGGIGGRKAIGADTLYCLRVDVVNDLLELLKVVAGTETQLGTFSVTIDAATDYTIKLSMVGSAIKGYLAGVERISVTDSAISAAGRAAIRLTAGGGATTGVHVDSLTATDTPASTAKKLASLGVG